MDHNNIELRSEEVQEILTRIPHWTIRWGMIVVTSIILMLLFTSWFIEYPDIISTEITITTNIPPQKLVANTSGKIEAILVKDKATVGINMPLAVIQNTASYTDVFLLKSIIDKINIRKNNFPFDLLINKQFGDIEGSFATFQKEYTANELNKDLQPFQMESNSQNSEKSQIQERLSILQQQKSINESELVLQKNDLNRFETLFTKGIISAQDFDNKKLIYLQAEKNYKNLLSNISQLKSSLIENNRNNKGTKISGTKEDVNLQGSMIQSFYQLKKVIEDWELAYVLKSSVAGKVTFLQIWTENQTINAGDNVFSVIPAIENGYIGKVKALAQNSGKIKVGQVVNIRLANFPDREFGVLKGKIKNISLVPDKDGNLIIDVDLPNKLETSYHKTIPFQQEMKGSADIVTEDLRLLERILYQFRSIFHS